MSGGMLPPPDAYILDVPTPSSAEDAVPPRPSRKNATLPAGPALSPEERAEVERILAGEDATAPVRLEGREGDSEFEAELEHLQRRKSRKLFLQQ